MDGTTDDRNQTCQQRLTNKSYRGNEPSSQVGCVLVTHHPHLFAGGVWMVRDKHAPYLNLP
ncbi:hypothetical protein Poly51_32550 [Rubripirellula tenax]|uniref:Uncharacterized protein n=1 Tax=Rubripirellula tenax TaxID=2528015 RepID=A0A5C6F3B4_9BACT|nr:hypothetical protein Poly51_32550 [Rubripirellula tenax]